MSDDGLVVQICRRVHPGLELDVELALGDGCGVIFGRSGAGKTSLLRAIAGLVRPDSGRVAIGDELLFDSAAGVDRPLRARRIGLIHQDGLLFPHLDAAGNVRYGLKGWTRRAADDRLAEIAAVCGVDHLLGRRVDQLSGGERQRVGLARALAPRPRLLLSDEPVSALDLDGRRALIARLAAARKAEGVPLLHVTHSPAEALAIGDVLFRLEAGRIVAQGPPIEILGDSQSGVAEAWAGDINVFEGRVESHSDPDGETTIRLAGGPLLIVPRRLAAVGSTLTVAVDASEILLARGPVPGLSARNILDGRVARVILRGPEAEILVQSGATTWVVAVVARAVASLALVPGEPVSMIVKARSCRILEGFETGS